MKYLYVFSLLIISATAALGQLQKIQPEDSHRNQLFGVALELSDDGLWLAVSATGDQTNQTNGGAVYLYAREADSWRLAQKINAPTTTAYPEQRFGQSISLHDGLLAVTTNPSGLNSPRLFIYELDDQEWKLVYNTEISFNPTSAMLPGDYIQGIQIVNEDLLYISFILSSFGFGGVAAYVKNDNGQWSELNNGSSLATFGVSKSPLPLVTDGQDVFVGVPNLQNGLFTDPSIQKITLTNRILNQQIVIKGPPGLEGFGNSLAINNDLMVVGVAAGSEDNDKVMLYHQAAADDWRLINTFESPTADISEFGRRLEMQDQTIYISGRQNASQGIIEKVFVYSNDSGNWAYSHTLESQNPSGNDLFAHQISASGDLLAIGAPADATSYTWGGAVYVGSDALTSLTDEPQQSTTYSLYPNPAVDEVTLATDLKETHFTHISITDAAGRMIYQKEWTNSQRKQLDLRSWSPGIYFVHLNSPSGHQTLKMVKKDQ